MSDFVDSDIQVVRYILYVRRHGQKLRGVHLAATGDFGKRSV